MLQKWPLTLLMRYLNRIGIRYPYLEVDSTLLPYTTEEEYLQYYRESRGWYPAVKRSHLTLKSMHFQVDTEQNLMEEVRSYAFSRSCNCPRDQ
jgi:hypothetical protein